MDFLAHIRLDFFLLIYLYQETIRTNIQIYLYPKNNTNEHPNLFVSKTLYDYDTHKYLYRKIFGYPNIRHTLLPVTDTLGGYEQDKIARSGVGTPVSDTPPQLAQKFCKEFKDGGDKKHCQGIDF